MALGVWWGGAGRGEVGVGGLQTSLLAGRGVCVLTELSKRICEQKPLRWPDGKGGGLSQYNLEVWGRGEGAKTASSGYSLLTVANISYKYMFNLLTTYEILGISIRF